MIELEEFEEGNPVNKEREKFNRRNEAILYHEDPVGAVFIGDSITAYWDIDSYFRHTEGKRLINRGVSDDYSMYCRRRFEADALQLNPELIILSVGVNNTKEASDSEKAADIIQQVVSDIRAMVEESKNRGINIVIPSVTSINRPHTDLQGIRQDAIIEINRRLIEFATEENIHFLNYYDVMTIDDKLNPELTIDGLHPHVKGYDKMAEVLTKQIKSIKLQ
ncbi:SGNH/GDSL hydrolase family protein [Macrococcus brunensis]|uniref:SGNH/GDSL hydrolase family protein n=1 Tax=Macrococcus brunensis TaxID=198483 RepID=UPI001EF0BC79|nr:GDSL-type esterase/lipase family protein [Macrococcus brunensis]ULG73602.1 GDSL-type esterase/lipase family protein [Macrococcus brunensis]